MSDLGSSNHSDKPISNNATPPNGGPEEPVPTETTVMAVTNGPLYVRGDVTVTAEDGRVLRRDTRMALCRCGASATKPFCDTSHLRINFQAP